MKIFKTIAFHSVTRVQFFVGILRYENLKTRNMYLSVDVLLLPMHLPIGGQSRALWMLLNEMSSAESERQGNYFYKSFRL